MVRVSVRLRKKSVGTFDSFDSFDISVQKFSGPLKSLQVIFGQVI